LFVDSLKITITDTIGDLRHPGTSGFSDLVWGFAHELSRRGHAVQVVGLYPDGFNVEAGNVRITTVSPNHRRNILTYFWDVARVARAAAASDADVIHVLDCVTAGMLCVLPAHRRTTYHGNMNVRSHRRNVAQLPWSPSMYALMRTTTAIACRRASRLISFGPSLNDKWIESGANPNRIVVLPNPAELVTPLPRAPIPDTALYVGRFSREKGGILELVQAMSLLPANVRLIVAGDGPLRADVESLVSALGLDKRITLLGMQAPADVRKLYAHASLVVLPSANEMLPRVMLEAWHAGVAFAGTPVGAVPDYLQDGENGYVIPSSSPTDIAHTIQRALQDDESRQRIESRARVSAQEMDIRKVTERLITQVYEPMVSERRKRSARPGNTQAKHSSELMN
jgi:glycosyltransferase involved in cell wall biosynthesis